MSYWSWWVSGLALSFVMLFHWFALHRMMAVSGRLSGLVDRLRFGKAKPQVEMTTEEIMAAISAVTAAEFQDLEHADDFSDEDAAEPVPMSNTERAASVPQETAPLITTPRTPAEHILFLASLIAGGGLAKLLAGSFQVSPWLNSHEFVSMSGGGPLASFSLLLVGGILVGFGTRMAGGCTSGHGLCGTSRLQPGSWLATFAFFGAGVVTSLGIEAVL